MVKKKSTSRKKTPVRKGVTKKKGVTKSGKKLGAWKVKRVGENQVMLTIPAGMNIVGDKLTAEDVLGAISNYLVVKKGRVLGCCSGNIAIA